MYRPSLLVFLAVVLALVAKLATASIIVVNSAGDEFGENTDHCTLREAVQAANTNSAFGGCPAGSANGTDIIRIPGVRLSRTGAGENANATGDLDITSAIQIESLGRNNHVLASIVGNDDRIFDLIGSAAALYLYSLDMRGGIPGGNQSGGVIRHTIGSLYINDSGLSDGLADYGGGLYSSGTGTLQLTRVTVYNNTAHLRGGGIYTLKSNDHYLKAVTVSGNTAALSGGGIYTTGHLHLNSSTVADNNAPDGAGLQFNGIQADAGSVTLDNTLLTNNSVAAGIGRNSDLLCKDGILYGGGYNLIGHTLCALTHSVGTLYGVDPKLAPLYRYGADMPVHALLDGSAAINAGAISSASVPCTSSDAYMRLRIDRCDIGAYEQGFDFTVNTTADDVDDNYGDGICHTAAGKCSLRAAMGESTGRSGKVIRLPAGTYPLTKRLGVDFGYAPLQFAIFGAGATATQITGGGSDDRLFSMNGYDYDWDFALYPIHLALVGMTLRNGVAYDTEYRSGGGAVYAGDADVLLVDDIVRDNHSVGSCGGAITAGGFWGTGVARLERVAVIDNIAESSAKSFGGGICGRAYLRNSTLSHNQADTGGGMSGSGEIINSTVAGNVASTGGGLRGYDVILKNSIVANNHFPAGSTVGTGADCSAADGHVIQSQGGNLIGSTLDCALDGDTASDVTNTSPGLSPLDRGAMPLPALAMNSRSPALNLVPNPDCFDAAGRRIWVDQYGNKRPAAGSAACDAGALEGNPTDIIFADGTEFNP